MRHFLNIVAFKDIDRPVGTFFDCPFLDRKFYGSYY